MPFSNPNDNNEFQEIIGNINYLDYKSDKFEEYFNAHWMNYFEIRIFIFTNLDKKVN